MVENVAREMTVWIQQELMGLMQKSYPSIHFLPLHDGVPNAEYDLDAELMELPHVFRTTLDTLPGSVPYLHASARYDLRNGSWLQVGVVWESGNWNPARSVPLDTLRPLIERFPEITWHALQRGPALKEWPIGWGPISGSDRVEEAAAAMEAMDLVISVDSFTAHLAGALGRPTWTLLHEPADWRWMDVREDSPWYPTMRLFRQRRGGGWAQVIEDLATSLGARTSRSAV